VNAISADETYLVMSANTSKAAAREILEYYSFIKNYKLLFTKLDETPVPGIIVNARYLTGRPLSYTTAGQSVPDDLDVANPKAIVSSFLSHKRTSE
jgi:flagellar biosynthesis protein FlhF